MKHAEGATEAEGLLFGFLRAAISFGATTGLRGL